MSNAEKLVEVWRGPILESQHRGHAVISDAKGEIRASWGDPDLVFLPRSSSKMLQALPLIESGAADKFQLTPKHLALACASHQGAAIHTDVVANWIDTLGLQDSDFLCGAHEPDDRDAREALIRAGEMPCQIHNNCSGKHAGFLTLAQHLGAAPDYTAIDNPVQLAAREAFEDLTESRLKEYGIDGCAAPNFATTMKSLAHAMAKMAAGETGSDVRNKAATRLISAMAQYPELVAGEKRACTEMMRAMGGRVAIKTGAEAVFVAILPDQGLGVAVKIEDGGTRAAEAVIASLLVQLGVLDVNHPAAQKRLYGPIRNWRREETGHYRVLV